MPPDIGKTKLKSTLDKIINQMNAPTTEKDNPVNIKGLDNNLMID